jgi:hypothetical protein
LVIDFLKRWGIDSPELVFELTDHYCEKAKERMEQGWSFQKALDSWKTKKHMKELRQIQTDYEVIVKKKWWKAHLQAIKKLFLSRQLFLFLGVLALMFLSYWFELGYVFSFVMIVITLLVTFAAVYLQWASRFGWYFQTRELTLPFMGGWLPIYELISHGGHVAVFSGEPVELSMITVTISITCGFIGYNLLLGANRELKLITDEYIREPQKFQQR